MPFASCLLPLASNLIPFFEILARHTNRRGRPQGYAPTDIYVTIFEKWYKNCCFYSFRFIFCHERFSHCHP
ncbi:hypothetical protein E1H12_05215 [Geitlerinema sp. P-1104]|nr:hypothetical protein [Geitlerinema sp. P-1104]